jgi:hypothetical protein
MARTLMPMTLRAGGPAGTDGLVRRSTVREALIDAGTRSEGTP